MIFFFITFYHLILAGKTLVKLSVSNCPIMSHFVFHLYLSLTLQNRRIYGGCAHLHALPRLSSRDSVGVRSKRVGRGVCMEVGGLFIFIGW